MFMEGGDRVLNSDSHARLPLFSAYDSADSCCHSSDLYCQRLMRLKKEVEEKRPKLINRNGVIFHHDNAIPHIFLATQQILREFSGKVLLHQPYSPDLAPSDFHLFRSLQNSLAGESGFFVRSSPGARRQWAGCVAGLGKYMHFHTINPRAPRPPHPALSSRLTLISCINFDRFAKRGRQLQLNYGIKHNKA
ncbi:Mariner Mos1 transposase [Eumeta japonica]|uniref:Mariner Mos1 transposase n=1 Tax=Eumeta variegata TaxID=151549 RepID=A0A4C1TR24_EUMVA|nr:Mariner Mos1 transposase [Eumeta japonica]